MTGYRDQRTFESGRHVLYEAGFADAGGSLEEHWQLLLEAGGEGLDFVSEGEVVRSLAWVR